jgi:hypothetical protein
MALLAYISTSQNKTCQGKALKIILPHHHRKRKLFYNADNWSTEELKRICNKLDYGEKVRACLSIAKSGSLFFFTIRDDVKKGFIILKPVGKRFDLNCSSLLAHYIIRRLSCVYACVCISICVCDLILKKKKND